MLGRAFVVAVALACATPAMGAAPHSHAHGPEPTHSDVVLKGPGTEFGSKYGSMLDGSHTTHVQRYAEGKDAQRSHREGEKREVYAPMYSKGRGRWKSVDEVAADEAASKPTATDFYTPEEMPLLPEPKVKAARLFGQSPSLRSQSNPNSAVGMMANGADNN